MERDAVSGAAPCERVDVVVVGGGLPAAATAVLASRAGLNVSRLAMPGDADGNLDRVLASPFELLRPRSHGRVDLNLMRSIAQWRLPEWRAALRQLGNIRHVTHRLLPGKELDPERAALFRVALLRQAVRLYREAALAGGRAIPSALDCLVLLGESDRGARSRLQATADLAGLDIGEPGALEVVPAARRSGWRVATGAVLLGTDAFDELSPRTSLYRLESEARAARTRLARDGEGWLVETSAGPLRARNVVFASVEGLVAVAPSMARRLPLGRCLVASQHYARLHQGFTPIASSDGDFSAFEVPRGIRVSLAPRMILTRGMAERALQAIVLGDLAGIVGEPRDMLRLDTVWEAPDALPLAGEVPGARGVWLNLCGGDQGAVIGVALAQLLVFWMRGGSVEETWKPISPQRFWGAGNT